MKKTLLLVASVAFAAPQAFAQAKSFEGFSLGANMAITTSTVDFTKAGITLSNNDTTTGLDLQAQYAAALGPQFVLGVGVTAGTGVNKAGALTSGGTTIEFTTKNRTSFDIIPGYAISDTAMVFG